MRAPTQRSFSALPDGICARAVDNSVDNVDKCAYSREIAARMAVDAAVRTAAKPAVKSTAKSVVDRRSESNLLHRKSGRMRDASDGQEAIRQTAPPFHKFAHL